MATLVKFQDFAEQLGKGIHNLDTDTHKLFLSSSAPDTAGDAALTDVAGLIATTNISGGVFPTITTQYTEASGTGTFAGDAVVVTAGGTVPTFRYYGIYNDTATSPADALICYWDHGSNVDLATGETFTVTFGADATMGTILTVA
jgi:hypothetical protein